MPEQPAPVDADGMPVNEDRFFILRDCRELLQRRLQELILQSTSAGLRAVEAFSKEISEGFDTLANSSQRDGFETTDGLTASRISLVGNDDLELEIRIGDLTGRLRGNDRIDLWQTQLRFMTLLQRPGMSADNNPAGMQPLACALWALSRESSGTLEQKLDQLEHIEDFFQARLPAVYAELNQLLERHHVAPTAVQPIQRSKEGQTKPAGETALPTANVLAALQQAMRQKTEGGGGSGAGVGGAGGDLGNGVLPPGSVASTSNQMLDAATLVMLKHLMQRLSALEAQKTAADGENPPLRALTAKDFDLPLGQPAAVALDTLSLIFEVIFTTPELPDTVKAAIARLQIPLLKLALQDASLFANEQHPARRLINRMARAAVGLSPETGRDHPICSALLTLADAVHGMLENGDGELAPYLEQLETLITARDQQHRDSAQPYVQLTLEHQAAEQARRDAEDWLGKVRDKTSEPSIQAFLADHWQEFMYRACLEGGLRGTQWLEGAATTDELLWSLSPKQTAEDRKKLLTLIPQLLKRLNAGLDLLAVSKEARTPFLDACFELQTAALRGRLEPQQNAAIDNPYRTTNATPGDETNIHILEREGRLVQYLGRPSADRSPIRAANKPWRVGDWIRFRLPDGEKPCGQLCWQSNPAAGSILLFNLDWGYAIACAPERLETQLKSGEAQIVTEAALFDVAAQKALQGINPG